MKRLLIIALLTGTAFAQGGTTSSNILPATTGQDLGKTTQRWDGFFQDVDIRGALTLSESVRVDPLDSMPGDVHGLISSLGIRVEASDQDHRPIFYCTSDIGGPCVSIHSLDTTLGRATSYEKGDGGGGARLFQRTIIGAVCNLGAIGGYGAVAGIDSGKDDFAIGYGMASDCMGASADLALKFRSNQYGDTWWLSADGSWIPQRDSASITVGYGTGKGKLRISNSNGATISFYNLRDGAAWMTFDNGVVGVPAWMSASGGMDASRLQLTSLAGVVCNESNKGTWNYIAGASGAKDTVQICDKDATDTYAWRSFYFAGTPITLGNSSTALSRYAKYTMAISPAEVAANTCAGQGVAVTGVKADDIIIGFKKPTEQAGLSLTGARATADDTVMLQFCNNTASPITPTASETYTFIVVQ